MRGPTTLRDCVIILFLLDTSLRASELCALEVGDIDLKRGKVSVKHGQRRGVKGSKGRVVYIGKTARKAVWSYLVSREDQENQDAPLFVGRTG